MNGFDKVKGEERKIWKNLQNKLRISIFVQKHPLLKGCKNFSTGELKRGGGNMHFNAESVSQKMIIELISSVNDICMHYGLCDYLGKNKTGRS